MSDERFFVYEFVDNYMDWVRNISSTYRRILDVPRYRYLMDICLNEYVEGIRFVMTDSEFQAFRDEIVYRHQIRLSIEYENFETYYHNRHFIEGGLDMPLPEHLAHVTDLRSVFLDHLYETFFPRRLDRVVSPVRYGGLRDVFEDPPQLLE